MDTVPVLSRATRQFKCQPTYLAHLRAAFSLTYDDLTAQPQLQLDRIFRFLGVAAMDVTLDATLKMGADDVYDSIKNSSQVRDALAGTRWAVQRQ